MVNHFGLLEVAREKALIGLAVPMGSKFVLCFIEHRIFAFSEHEI